MPKRQRTVFDAEPPIWKVRDMIEKLGGVGTLVDKLSAKGFFAPSVDTVQGWSVRSSLPGAWSPVVFALAMEEGLIRTPMDALVKDFKLTPLKEPV